MSVVIVVRGIFSLYLFDLFEYYNQCLLFPEEGKKCRQQIEILSCAYACCSRMLLIISAGMELALCTVF